MGRMAWGATTPRVCLGSVAIGKRLWRGRAVKKSQSRLSHRAWKSRPKRGIPTSPQPRRRRVINRQPDNSLATKTGPFNLLRTGARLDPRIAALVRVDLEHAHRYEACDNSCEKYARLEIGSSDIFARVRDSRKSERIC